MRDATELARDIAREKFEGARDLKKKMYDKRAVEREFVEGDMV